MAAKLLRTKRIAQGHPAITAAGAQDLVAVTETYTVAAALELNDVIEMMELPPGHVPVDCILDVTDLDTGSPTLTLDVGTMAGTVGDTTLANRTLTANMIAASTAGQAGGVARMAVMGSTRLAPSDNRRSIGVKVSAAPATGATSGSITLTVFYRPAINGA